MLMTLVTINVVIRSLIRPRNDLYTGKAPIQHRQSIYECTPLMGLHHTTVFPRCA